MEKRDSDQAQGNSRRDKEMQCTWLPDSCNACGYRVMHREGGCVPRAGHKGALLLLSRSHLKTPKARRTQKWLPKQFLGI